MAKIKALICTFVFAYAKSRSSRDAAHMIKTQYEPKILTLSYGLLHYANTPMQYTAIFHYCKNVDF